MNDYERALIRYVVDGDIRNAQKQAKIILNKIATEKDRKFNELTRVDIPLVYQDNDLFLQQLQQATGRSIMRNDTDNPDAL